VWTDLAGQLARGGDGWRLPGWVGSEREASERAEHGERGGGK
jgi:hypothetical protein